MPPTTLMADVRPPHDQNAVCCVERVQTASVHMGEKRKKNRKKEGKKES